jgi:hypothetical protein
MLGTHTNDMRQRPTCLPRTFSRRASMALSMHTRARRARASHLASPQQHRIEHCDAPGCTPEHSGMPTHHSPLRRGRRAAQRRLVWKQWASRPDEQRSVGGRETMIALAADSSAASQLHPSQSTYRMRAGSSSGHFRCKNRGGHALFLSNFPRFIGRLFSEPRLGSGSPPTVEFDCASMAPCRPRVSRMDHFESERLAELRHVAV